MKFALLGLTLVAVAQGDSLCSYDGANCTGAETGCVDVPTANCVALYNDAQAGDCLDTPTTSCAAPNACQIGFTQKYKCNAVNFTNEAFAVKQGVQQTLFIQNWPLANCSGQPYASFTTKGVTNKCVITSTGTSAMMMKVESTATVAGVTVIQPKYTVVEFTNRYCIMGAENPYGRPSNWVERFQNVNKNTTYIFDTLETIGGVSGKCNAEEDNTTYPDTNTGSPPNVPWTLSSGNFVSLDQPSGLNLGMYLLDYSDGDVYSTTRTYTVANGSCYSNRMYTGCATSKSPMYVDVGTSGRFAGANTNRWPYVPGCNGTEYDHRYGVLGAEGCQSASAAKAAGDAPNSEMEMYTECSTSGNQITWKVQAYSDPDCEHVNDYLNGLTNFENFPGAAAGSSGAGWIRSTVTVVTAALLAAVLV